MSIKESSLTLQTRLAERLQKVTEVKSASMWLAVHASGRGFLLPLAQSGEIYPWVEPHSVPYTKDWFLGVVNLRGSLCGVASIAKYLALKTPTSMAEPVIRTSSTYTKEKRLVAFHPVLEMNTVLAVDKLAGLRRKDQLTRAASNGLFMDSDQQLWQEIDLGRLAKAPNFVSINAQ